MLFRVGAPEQKFWATARMSASYFRHFFSKRVLMCLDPQKFLYRNFGTCRIFYECIFGVTPHLKSSKKSIFRLFLKCDLDGFRYRFLVQNNSKTPQGPISGHISSFRPISATLSKFEFLAKIDFLANFGIFDFSKYDLPFGRKWPEI